MSQAEIEAMMAGGIPAAPAAPAPGAAPAAQPAAPAAAIPPAAAGDFGSMMAAMMAAMTTAMANNTAAPPAAPPEPKIINAAQPKMRELSADTRLNQEQKDNLDLILSVSLEVAVEIGRTRRKIQDILSFSKGSLVVLDKLAGDQVDLLVNGQCVAKGDVVVIDDNFGIRITEILQKPDINELVQG
jgi:flagellar motor switch protein FliN/FliY